MDKKVFILRDSKIRDRCKTFLDTFHLITEVYDLEERHCDDAKEYIDVQGTKRYRCEHKPKPIKVTVEDYKKNRSLAQNALMWKWLTLLSNHLRTETGLNTSPEDLKDHFQRLILGFREYQTPTGTYPPGRTRTIGTSEINTAQFTSFLNEIEVYAANVGLTLPHPEDLYYEAMQK